MATALVFSLLLCRDFLCFACVCVVAFPFLSQDDTPLDLLDKGLVSNITSDAAVALGKKQRKAKKDKGAKVQRERVCVCMCVCVKGGKQE